MSLTSRALSIVRHFFPFVERVEDAKKGLLITVTEQDVKKGKAGNPTKCVMAVACKRMQRATGVIVSRNTAYVVKGKKATRYKIPERITRETVVLDRGGRFSPGVYEFKAPYLYQRLGFHTSGKSGKKNGKAKNRYRLLDVRPTLSSITG